MSRPGIFPGMSKFTVVIESTWSHTSPWEDVKVYGKTYRLRELLKALRFRFSNEKKWVYVEVNSEESRIYGELAALLQLPRSIVFGEPYSSPGLVLVGLLQRELGFKCRRKRLFDPLSGTSTTKYICYAEYVNEEEIEKKARELGQRVRELLRRIRRELEY